MSKPQWKYHKQNTLVFSGSDGQTSHLYLQILPWLAHKAELEGPLGKLRLTRKGGLFKHQLVVSSPDGKEKLNVQGAGIPPLQWTGSYGQQGVEIAIKSFWNFEVVLKLDGQIVIAYRLKRKGFRRFLQIEEKSPSATSHLLHAALFFLVWHRLRERMGWRIRMWP